MSKCLVCNKELTTGDVYSTICNRCYNEIGFAEIDCRKFIDEEKVLLYQENKELKHKLADLESKLAEKNKTIDEINKEFLSAIKDWKQLVEIEKAENEKLKQQLAEKDEDLKATTESLYASREYLDQVTSEKWALEKQLTEKDKEMKELTECNQYLQIYRNQDKISFAVEQLEKVKELAHNHIKEIANDLSEEDDERLNQKHTIHGLATAITDIDNQIKQLKEMK